MPRFERIDMRVRYRGHSLDLHLTDDSLSLRSHEPGAAPVLVSVKRKEYLLYGGSSRTFAQEGGRETAAPD